MSETNIGNEGPIMDAPIASEPQDEAGINQVNDVNLCAPLQPYGAAEQPMDHFPTQTSENGGRGFVYAAEQANASDHDHGGDVAYISGQPISSQNAPAMTTDKSNAGTMDSYSQSNNDVSELVRFATYGVNTADASSNNYNNNLEFQYRSYRESEDSVKVAPNVADSKANSGADAVNSLLKNNRENSIWSWRSEKHNSSDSDSDMEVWTRPSTNSTTTSSTMSSNTQQQSWNQYATTGSAASTIRNTTLGSTISSLTSNLHGSVANPLSGYNQSWMQRYNMQIPLQVPNGHMSTWDCVLPSNYFTSNLYLLNAYNSIASGGYAKKKIVLSLINVWEFTLEGQVERGKIKSIAKGHVGKDGRKGAVFERAGILLDDPAFKGNSKNDTLGGAAEEGYKGGGKWKIPLGAYESLMGYLHSLDNTEVEGIPREQLQAATFGRERFEKGFPTADELMKRGVGKAVAHALAPYQRGGVDFILEKKGRALLADEMGLGKTIQAIAAMSAYRKEWPLLILTPSSARYHWEVEVRQWLKDVDMQEKKKVPKVDANWDGRKIQMVKSVITDDGKLKKEAVNVLTSGKSYILRGDETKVVIVSYGLIVSLINNNRITPGMFKAIIVDESHALKNKSSKRTIAVLPLLKAASRCVLLSGTPALARPSELWPQISVLGGKQEGGEVGLWMDEADFYAKYVRGEMADENASKARLAELHTLLTSSVMIRRMKADMLKNLQPKIREKAHIDVKDESLKNEFHTYMQMLKRGRGVMSKFARQQSTKNMSESDHQIEECHVTPNGEVVSSREALHHLYKITGKSKIKRVTNMLKKWLSDPTLGKLCIFAHHLDVLDEIARGAGLSNFVGSTSKYIRIDGATLPKARQEQILSFQTDPSVRIALLGITAAGVAVTLTASSTVWFAELFWTPAIMIQAEDRCHRIGQQARVRCLYFIARGTLDEILWKLIEKKFRDLGEFVEGRENMDIALERELEEEDESEILKVEEITTSKKRKSQDDVSEFFDLEDVGGSIKEEINDLVHEEEDMLKMKSEEDGEDEPDEEENETKPPPVEPSAAQTTASPEAAVVNLLDEDEKEAEPLKTVKEMRQSNTTNGALKGIELDKTVRFDNISLYRIQFRGQRYGFNMLYLKGRAIVKDPLNSGTRVGSIIVAVGSHVLAQEPFNKIRARMANEIQTNSFACLTFGEDEDFTALFKEEILPRFAKGKSRKVQAAREVAAAQQARAKPSETVDLLDDDE